MTEKIIKHPAKYTDTFLPIFAEKLINCKSIIDPFGGTGKIGDIKKHGYKGKITACDIEHEWINNKNVDHFIKCDAENLPFEKNSFDAICTSPTYGNRMADHFNSKDGSKRITYRHFLGKELNIENTGRMQWGKKYQEKHIKIYKEFKRILKNNGIFILNISDHIRKGEVQKVTEWHLKTLKDLGFKLIEEIKTETPRSKFGKNYQLRVPFETIAILKNS